eukprot:scaffold26864_cov63-Attheya_sp.AAC.1
MRSLFPSSLADGGMQTRGAQPTATPSQPQSLPEDSFDFTKGELLRYLSHVKKGNGAGPYADPTDCIRDMALHKHGKGQETPYLSSVTRYLQVFVHPNLSRKARDMFASSYAIAFHKDWLNHPEKLQPANIGTAARRIAAGILEHSLRFVLVLVLNHNS